MTPLHITTNKDLAQLLIAKGANVNAKNNIGETALHWAEDHEQKEIVELLIANDSDVNAKDNIGGTPLHRATDVCNKEIVELLITDGAEINAKNDDGDTPLDMADNKEILYLIRKHGGGTAEELKAEAISK